MSTRSLWPSLWRHDPESPRDPVTSLRHEIDRAFESFGRSLPEIAWPGEGFAPRLDVTEADGKLRIAAELPGVEAEDVDISVEGDMLTIAGEKKAERERGEGVSRLRERSWGAFTRAVRLPFEADPEKVEADFAKGVLTITVPVPEGARPAPKRIAVKTA